MVVRDAPSGGVEVLMLRRTKDLAFVGDTYVFPGGSLDPTDAELAHTSWVRNADALERRMPDEPSAAALGVTAIREAFEEAGILLGAHHQLEPAHWAAARQGLLAGELAFGAIVDEVGGLDLGVLHYVAHWVTPKGSPRRFDTRFFLAALPLDSVASPDHGEVAEARWLRPADVLRLHEQGDLPLVPPTIANVGWLAQWESTEVAIAGADALDEIPRIEPRFWRDGTELRIALPGDPAWERAGITTLAPGETIPSRVSPPNTR